MSTPENIARNLIQARKQKGLSQERLALASGVSIAQIKRIELAQTNVTVDLLNKLADALDVNVAELIKDTV